MGVVIAVVRPVLVEVARAAVVAAVEGGARAAVEIVRSRFGR